MKRPIIQFENFSFQYRAQAKPTLNNINLTIYEGEKVLIIGPSGSGKSTLTNAINGLIPFFYPGEIMGSLKVLGNETKNMSIFKISKLVGTVMQDPDNQFIGLTAAEDIAFKLENDCVPQDEMIAKVNIAARLVDIEAQLSSSPHKLSGGQKQRVTLAGVMVDDVDILIFDEPLANLDPATGKIAIELIDDIKNSTNKTIVIIEHRLEDVLHRDVDRIIVIDEGCIVAAMNSNKLLSSNILHKSGIREPLYITALKYAGCEITPDTNPKNINTLDINSCKEKLLLWYENTTEEFRKAETKGLIEFKDICFGYIKNREILHNLSFKINKSDMISIIGKNGAGKSTIAKLICGFYKPASGKILLNNRDISGDTIRQRSEIIGMVMQDPNQMISKNMIFDEVAFGLKVRGISEDFIKERVYNTLKICGLYEFRNWPISALSFGQKKRVTIASILVLNPEVIILDEPTAGQDFRHYNEIMEFLLELNGRGVTIIMITHDMHLMLEYSSRAIVLSDGFKIADNTAAYVLTEPDVISAANLKETSLYELAKRADLVNPRAFVNRFIEYDRRIRSK